MPDEPKKITAAECCIRGFFREERDPVATALAVLALERALLREGHVFEHFPDEDAGHSYEVDASALLDRDAYVAPYSDELGLQLMHVTDWIKAAVLEKAPWIERVDREGRPLKLTKIGSLDLATAVADKEMRRFAARMASVAVCADDEEVHAELGDGWSLVRLLSPTALDRESGLMQHCIGQGAYDQQLENPQYRYVSLRDPAGKPHATIELAFSDRLDKEVVLQLQGKQNARPVERHLRRVRPWLRENASPVDGQHGHDHPAYAWWSGFARTAGGMVDLLDPPPSVDLLDEIEFVLEEGDVLPSERLSSKTDVTIRIASGRTSPVVMPRTIAVAGKMRIHGPGTFVFGDGLDAGTFRAENCDVESLPAEFGAYGTEFENCRIDMIPASVRTSFLSLPNSHAVFERGFGTKVLDLTLSHVDALPQDLVVETLKISGCPLREIPDGTTVVHLTIAGTELRRIGRLEGKLRGLELRNVQPALRMPEEMSVGEMRVVGKTFPIRLPRMLVVEGTLKIERAPGIELPADLKVGRLISIDRCFDAIPDGTRVLQLLQLIDAGDVAVGEDCEFADIVVIEAADAKEAGRPPRMVSIDPDPAISRIAGDGTCEKRDRSFPM